MRATNGGIRPTMEPVNNKTTDGDDKCSLRVATCKGSQTPSSKDKATAH
uniref:Uncharacterized protein n=1 Tax=Nelumbo nucifera TaxID=4432 RepID=A0A822Y981_NELNU|nr:TPA_asm: hypothetical protein HUJ06_029589 [Nelumbo nucifera]